MTHPTTARHLDQPLDQTLPLSDADHPTDQTGPPSHVDHQTDPAPHQRETYHPQRDPAPPPPLPPPVTAPPTVQEAPPLDAAADPPDVELVDVGHNLLAVDRCPGELPMDVAGHLPLERLDVGHQRLPRVSDPDVRSRLIK